MDTAPSTAIARADPEGDALAGRDGHEEHLQRLLDRLRDAISNHADAMAVVYIARVEQLQGPARTPAEGGEEEYIVASSIPGTRQRSLDAAR